MRFSSRLIPSGLRQVTGYVGVLGFGVVAGALILAYLLAGDIYEYEDTVEVSHLPEVDAIVCLAGGRGRIAAAGDLWYRYWKIVNTPSSPIQKLPVLYFSGVGRQVNWAITAKQLKPQVLQVIHPENIVIENESSNTDTNARWLFRYAQKARWKNIVLLTSSYHMKRAHFIFDHVLKTMENPIDLETYSVNQEPFSLKLWRNDSIGVRVTLLEYLKWVYYRSIWKSL